MRNKSELSEAESEIILAADRLVREIMRHDLILSHLEEALVEAVLNYNRLKKTYFVSPSQIPNNSSVENFEALDLDFDDLEDGDRVTMRYSELVTKPSPACGIPAVKKK